MEGHEMNIKTRMFEIQQEIRKLVNESEALVMAHRLGYTDTDQEPPDNLVIGPWGMDKCDTS